MKGLSTAISRAVNDSVEKVVLEVIESRDTWVYRFYGSTKSGLVKVRWLEGARIGGIELELDGGKESH